jgi:hypothetical protein
MAIGKVEPYFYFHSKICVTTVKINQMKRKQWLLIVFLFLGLGKAHSQVDFTCPLNIPQSIQNASSATVTTSTLDIGSVSNIFDRNDATLVRSAGINPLVVTLSFAQTVNVSSARVIQSHGSGWFRLETADNLSDLNSQTGTYQLLLSMINTPDGVPIIQPISTSRKIFRLTVQKTPGDNYVHLNEWDLIGTVSHHAESLLPDPVMISMHPGWEIWLNEPTTSQCPQILAIQSAGSVLVSQQCIAWSVSDPTILALNTTTMKLLAIKAGTANLIATIGTANVTIPVTVTRVQSVGDPDLSVRYIKRLPEIDYVQNSTNPTVEGWPASGQAITWRAHVRNWSGNNYSNVSYEWRKNGVVIGSGLINLLPDEDKTIQISDTWAFQRDSIVLTIDNTNIVTETSELNNSLKIYTNALSANFYVEQSLYDYFHVNQHKLGVGSNSWDDWAQMLHVRRWNQMLQNAVFPEAPNGALDRIRIDSIVIVPDNSLPLAGGNPGNNPNINDKTVDLQWGFNSSGLLSGSMYTNHTSTTDANPFFFEGSLLHELGHARYLIDNYGMDVNTANVFILEGNINIGGSALMPIIAWDVLHYNQSPTLMSGIYDVIGLYEVMALNRIANRRAVCGNMNAPCNMGIYINDLPTNNFFKLKDQSNNILSNACIEVYRATPQTGHWYGKIFDDIPDASFTTDGNGEVNVGRNPFSATNIIHTFGYSSMDIIIRVEKNGKVGYKVIEASDFNIEYWKGNTTNASYTYTINMLSCGDFQGSACSCSVVVVPPPAITAGGATVFCQGGNVILTSSSANGNQWFKDGVAITGATANTYTAATTGIYTARITINGNESAASNTILITVNPIPATAAVTAGSVTTFCAGGNVTLTSNATGGNQWYKDGVALSGSNGTTLNVAASGSYTVKVTVNGCESAVSNAVVVTVSPNPPTATITASGSTIFCAGGSVTLTSSAANGNQWYKDGTTVNGSMSNTLTVTTSGSYTVKTTLNNCESQASTPVLVTVNSIPTTPTITQNGNQLTSSAVAGNQWYLNTGLIAGATGQNYIASSSGNYTVQVTLNNCTSAFSATLNFTPTALPNIDVFGNQIRILPNPVREKVRITRSSTSMTALNIHLTDMNGRLLKTLNSSASGVDIDMSGYASGVYIIIIEDKLSRLAGKKLLVKL